MIPKTISASSLNTADLCLARYKAENLDFTPSPDVKVAANIGTSVHGALEKYVECVYMAKTHTPSLDLLLAFYHGSYLTTFDTVESDTPEYKDGVAMLRKWFARTDLSGVEVLSVEKKTRMPVPTSAGDILLTYIWDRCDLFYEGGRKILRVVDYKTIRANLSPDDVRGKLQARIYDLAARSQFKDADIDEFHIVFDLLRHEPVGVVFSREEAVKTWDGIKARVERIIATDGANPPETLNAECGYCVRKVQCKALRRNIAGGGLFSIESIDEVVQLRYELASQQAGIKAALADLDGRIVKHAQNEYVLNFEAGPYKAAVSARKTRTIDSAAAAKALGPEIMSRYGKVTVSTVDEIIESGDLTQEQVKALHEAMSFSISAESVKVTPRK